MTVKVGQVYKKANEKYDWRFVITYVATSGNYIDYIYDDGCVIGDNDVDEVLEDSELIAEYPTWIAAVNSPEFRKINKTLGRM